MGVLYDFLPLERLPVDLATALLADLDALGVPASTGFYDLRGAAVLAETARVAAEDTAL